MQTLYEYGSQIKVPNRKGLESYLYSLWGEYKDLWPESTYATEESTNNLYQPFLSFDGDLARANNFIGFINYEDVAIEIYPKVFRHMASPNKEQMHRHLFYWLSYCKKIRFPFNQSYLDTFDIQQLPELIMYLIARQISDTVNLHPYSAYEEVQEPLSSPKGRIDFNRYTNHLSYGSFHQIDCVYEPFVFDNLLNRAIKYCVRLLLSKTRLPQTQTVLNEIIFLLDEVEDTYCSAAELDSIKLNPVYESYSEIVSICRMILENQIYSPVAYEMKNWTLLFPMEYIFEDFITGFIQDHFGKDYWVEPQKSNLYLHNEPNTFNLQHDILLTHKITKEEIIVDTKYKPREKAAASDNKKGVSQTDMYQMISYAYRRGTDKVLLIYPNAIDQQIEEHTFKVKNARSNEAIKITAIDVPFWSEQDHREINENLLAKLKNILIL